MKRYMIFVSATFLFSLMLVPAQASIETIVFKGNDIVAPCTTANPGTTPVVGDGYITTLTSGTVKTYGPTASVNTFNSWLSNLKDGEGISSFNLWLQDGASNQAAMWGETIALRDAYSSDIQVFCSAGWTGSVYTVGDEWGDWWKGRQLITFTADSPSDYLKPGTTASFGFTADVIGNDGATGPTYQMWVGAGNPYGIFSDNVTSDGLFQRAIEANAIPEPATVIIWSLLGGLGLVFAWRKRKVV